MNSFARLVSIGALLALAACSGGQQAGGNGDGRDEMTVVINSVTIAGAPEAVFDLVTSARFWPQWHPATQVVGGVTERPYRLGERISEAGRIGTQEFQTSWKVAEWIRPSLVVLQSEKSSTRIAYSFQAREGGTVFTRRLEYRLENFNAAAADRRAAEQLMSSQSEQAVSQLKLLVERILRQETLGIQ